MTDLKKKITDYVKSDKFQDKWGNAEDIEYNEEIGKMLYDIVSDCGLEVEFTNCDTGSDCWIEATVYVKNLLGEHKGYNVIIDVDFTASFDNWEEVIEAVMNAELHAQNVLAYFKK